MIDSLRVRPVRSARLDGNGDEKAAVIDPLADDHQTMRALGRRAREQLEARGHAWEAVTRGERGEEEVAAERLAAGDAPESVALARAIFRPPDEAEHAALVDGLLARQVASRRSAGPATAVEPAADDSGRRWWVATLAVAAVVALAWWLVPGDPGSPTQQPDAPLVAHAAIPTYEPLETEGGLTVTRSEPAEPGAVHRYRADTPLEWRVRPKVAVDGPIGARLFAFGRDAATELAAAGLVEVSVSGAVRVAGRFGALGLTPGSWTIAIVVGRPAALPSDPALVRDAQDSEAWIVRRLSIIVED